jgi:hypothetical protein
MESLVRGGEYSFQSSQVRTARLDDILASEGIAPGSVAAVKIDVEGAELAVLEGGIRFFREFTGPVVCEFWFSPLPPKGWTWLREHGYACRKLDHAGRGFQDALTREDLESLARGETYGNFWCHRPG